MVHAAFQPDIDDCVDEPCLNGATCIDALTDYSCTCAAGYTGENCETGIHLLRDSFYTSTVVQHITFPTTADIDECEAAPCLNGATCTDEVNGYSCECAAGYTGEDCETGMVMCLSVGRCYGIINFVNVQTSMSVKLPHA